jgi:hypothetical protein
MKKRIINICLLAVMLMALLFPFNAVLADNSLPKGFVTPASVGIKDWNTMTSAVHNDLDAIYLIPYMVKSDIIVPAAEKYYFGDNNYIRIKAEPLIVANSSFKGKKDISTKVSAEEHFTNVDHSTTYKLDYTLKVDITDLSLDSFQVQYSIQGTEKILMQHTTDGTTYKNSYESKPDTKYELGTWQFGDDGKIYADIFFPMDKPEDVEQKYWWYNCRMRFEVAGVHKKTGGASGGSETDANTETGEFPIPIPAAIIVGVGATLAAISGKSGSSEDKDKKGSRFVMYIGKDFGNSIRRGAKAIPVRARMAEITEGGAEKDRPDVTSQIVVYSGDLNIESTSFDGRYMEAYVSGDKDMTDDTGIIDFRFEGENGTFDNKIRFRIIDDASLSFIEETDHETMKLLGNETYIQAILGDGADYKVRFFIENANDDPIEISADESNDFSLSFDYTERQYTYQATLTNKTQAPVEKSFFAEPMRCTESFVAKYDDGTELRGYIHVELYPEGLTVRAKTENGRVKVDSFEKEDAGDFDEKFQSAELDFTLAVKTADGVKFVDLIDETKLEFGDLKGEGEANEKTAEKYEFKVEGVTDNKYYFKPNTVLYETKEQFYMSLPVSCEYEGTQYSAEIPLWLIGKPIPPMSNWDKEYNLFVRNVKKLAPVEKRQGLLDMLEELNKNRKIPATHLRAMNKQFIEDYMVYVTKLQEDSYSELNTYEWIVYGLEWVKFIGDCAFSVVMVAYTGPVGEAVLSPAKEIFVNALGECWMHIYHGEPFDIEKLEVAKNLKNAADNVVANSVTDSIMANPLAWRKNLALIAGYFVFACFNNYLEIMAETGESNLMGAIYKAFSDLTVNAIKGAASALFGKWIKSASFQKMAGTKIGTYLRNAIKDSKVFQVDDIFIGKDGVRLTGELVELTKKQYFEKFFSDLCGGKAEEIMEGFEKILEKEVYRGDEFTTNTKGDILFTTHFSAFDDETYSITLNLTKLFALATGNLYTAFFRDIFGDVPTASDVKSFPEDPQIPHHEVTKQ